MKIRTLTAAVGLALALADIAQAGEKPIPSRAELWRIVQQQQAELETLKARLAGTDRKAEAAVEAVEQARGATSPKSAWAERTRLGGYGELHYNSLDGSGGAGDKDEIDFHRFVVYFGHDFNDRLRFRSELEVEHALTVDTADGSGPGEVELEQAYIEYDLNDRHLARGGVFLVPVGILNETHEPDTFYGVERNPIESNVIPSTWWAGGAALAGELAPGWRYDLALHEGLETSAGSRYAVRSGRQKTAKATMKDPAVTGRLKWTGAPGVELAATVQYQGDVTQGADPAAGSATLVEAHAALQRGPFGLRALYARWDLDGDGPASIGADEQSGWFVEPSYRLSDSLGVFARYSQWDNLAGSDAVASRRRQFDAGVNWWLHPNVVIKADYQQQDNENDANQDGFNLGIGYQF